MFSDSLLRGVCVYSHDSPLSTLCGWIMPGVRGPCWGHSEGNFLQHGVSSAPFLSGRILEQFICRMTKMLCHSTRETSRKSELCVFCSFYSSGTASPYWYRRHITLNNTVSLCVCVCVYRCLHTDSCWSCDDAGGIPRMLWCHSGISVPAGNSEWLPSLCSCSIFSINSFILKQISFFFCSSSSFWWYSLPVRWLQLSGVSWTGTLWVYHTHTHIRHVFHLFDVTSLKPPA